MELNINPDYIQFKNDILKDIREFEKRLAEQIKMKHNSYDSILSDVKERLEKIEKDSKASTLSIIEIKSKIEQFNEFLTYKQNLDSSIYSQEMRIKVALDEVYRLKSKHDKIINDNLMVPGIIGGSCRFKNLKDYINFNTTEISRMKSWQEDQKRLAAEFKKKLDNVSVNMVNMIDSALKQSNEMNEQIRKDNITKLEEKLEELNRRLLEIRAEYSNSMTTYEEKQNHLKEQINNFANIKTDILDTIDEKLKKVKEKEKDKEKLKKILKDIDELKKRKNKKDEQIEINAKSIKEIKDKLKRMNNENILKQRKARMSFSNTNFISFLKNKNDIQSKIEHPLPHPLSAKRKKDEIDTNKSYDSEKSLKIDNKSEKSKNENDINKITNKNRLSAENVITNNNKIKVSHFNPINSRNRYSAGKKNELNNKESNGNMTKQDLNNNSVHYSSSSLSNSLSRSKIKANKNKNISINKNPKFIDEDINIINKMANLEENRKETQKMKSREDIELNILKSKINKTKDLLKVIDNKNLKILNKTVNLKDHELNSNINNSLKAYNLNGNLNSNINNNININYNLFKNYDYNYENSDKNLINDIIINSGNNGNIRNKNKNLINLNVKSKGTSIDLNTNEINQNIYQNINKKKTNEIKLFHNIEKYKNNSNLSTNKKLNLDFINSSLTNNQNKNNYKINESTYYNYYTSRTDSRKYPDYQISDADIKINNVDLYKKTKKKINESDHKQHYSFSGKKIRQKIKEKSEEISPVDYLYKLYFVKKNKDVILNNLKKITPAFGRTAYTFYDMKKNNELGISPY